MENRQKNHQGPKAMFIRDRKLSSIDAEISAEKLRKARGVNSDFSHFGYETIYYRKMMRDRLFKAYDINEAL